MADDKNDPEGVLPFGAPIEPARLGSLPPRRPHRSDWGDELTASIVTRDQRINQLLRREFGTLAPPPVATLDGQRANDGVSRQRHRDIESRRREYEALDPESLSSLVAEAVAERAREAQEHSERVQAERTRRWPHWAGKDLWSEDELATLCCGFIPEERGMPVDPGKAPNDDARVIAINRAADDIRRGTLSGTLEFVPRDDADTAARMYGTARHYVPSKAALWAASRFETFPAGLETAIRRRAQFAPPTVRGKWPWGSHETLLLRMLAAAADKFWANYDPADATTAPTNDEVCRWLGTQGVADRNAQVIATILRVDGLPTGPRK